MSMDNKTTDSRLEGIPWECASTTHTHTHTHTHTCVHARTCKANCTHPQANTQIPNMVNVWGWEGERRTAACHVSTQALSFHFR